MSIFIAKMSHIFNIFVIFYQKHINSFAPYKTLVKSIVYIFELQKSKTEAINLFPCFSLVKIYINLFLYLLLILIERLIVIPFLL